MKKLTGAVLRGFASIANGFASIADGMASVMSMGSYRPGRVRAYRKPLTAQLARQADRQALASDWQKVGDDMRRAFGRAIPDYDLSKVSRIEEAQKKRQEALKQRR
jgi:hypothetical protein